jgi:hypothetical protein
MIFNHSVRSLCLCFARLARVASFCFAGSACGSIAENPHTTGSATSSASAGGADAASTSATGGGGASTGQGGSDGTGGIADCNAPQISALSAGQDSVNSIALDADTVYWTNYSETASQGQIRSVPKAGGPLTVIASTGKLRPWDIVVSGSRVFWSTRGATTVGTKTYLQTKILSAPKAGGPSAPTELSSSLEALATGLAVDDKSVYWSTDHDEIFSTPRSSVDAFPTVILANDPKFQLVRRNLTVDATHLYWMEADVNIASMPKSGGSPTTLTVQPPESFHFAMDAKRLYWGETDLGHIRSLPKGGGTPKILSEGEDLVLGIAVNSTCVYWMSTTQFEQRVRAVSKNGGAAAITIAVVAKSTSLAVAADETHVYWEDLSTHSIMQASK